jgi:hypothetical protein
MHSAKKYLDSDGGLVDEFFQKTGELREILVKARVPVRSEPRIIFEQYKKANYERQRAFLNKIEFYSSLCKEALSISIDLLADKKFIWLTFRRLGCFPPAELMDRIKDGDAVEIYTADTGVLEFCNFDFCRNIGYTVEQLFWDPWHDLFYREEKYMGQIMDEFKRSVTVATGPFTPNIEEHTCYETNSLSGNSINVKMKMFSPVKSKSGQVKFMIATSDLEVVQKKASADAAAFVKAENFDGVLTRVPGSESTLS